MFTAPLPKWDNPGVQPPPTLVSSGWLPDVSPAPDFFNWQWYRVYTALKELQDFAADKREISDQALKDHEKAAMPHQFTQGGKTYKYGFKTNIAMDGLIFVYEEVI